MEEKKDQSPSGWQCPICKTVYSPDVKECKKCSVTEGSSKIDVQLLID